MHFENTVTVKAPIEEIWDFYWEHEERVFPCIKGFQKAEVIDPSKKYKLYIMEKVGPFKVNFAVEVEITEMEKLKCVKGKATGKDSRIASRFSQQGVLKLKNISPDETELFFTTDVSIFGKLAVLGNRIIKRKADEAMEYFARSIKAQLENNGGVQP